MWIIFLVLMCDALLCFVTFPSNILGQVWYLIVSILDICLLKYFYKMSLFENEAQSKFVIVIFNCLMFLFPNCIH